MKKDMRIIVGLMIAVIAIGGLFLWSQKKSAEDILGSLDPESYDVETTCIAKNGQYLICNEGNDTLLIYDDVEVYLQKIDTVVEENGDEVTKTEFKTASISKLEKLLEQDQSVLLHLWLTDHGKIETIMLVESSYTNHNATLSNLEGLDPNSYQSTNLMMDMDKDGMKLAPVNYTEAEQDKFEGLINQYDFAKNVKFYLGSVTLGSDAEGNQTKNIQYVKLSYRDMLRLEEGVTVHVWFNEEGQVTHVIVHQETVVE